MRHGGRPSRPLTAMATPLGFVACLTVLTTLLQPSISEHKKKIIVKVPHLIKHIHHDVYKPVHVHKVHAKKVEHHHHEEHEEKLPKWRPKKERGGKHKAYGSYSHLRPTLLHQDSHEHTASAGHRQGLEYGAGQEYGRGHEHHRERDYSQEGDWSSESGSGERRTKHTSGDSHEQRPKWEPISLGDWFGGPGKGERDSNEWLISSEDLRELREDYGFPGGKGTSVNGHKRKKDKALSLPSKHHTPEPERDGWKPMMDFSGWKDVEDLHKKGPQRFNSDSFNYSGEDESKSSSEEDNRGERGRYESGLSERKKQRKHSKKNGKWSKQIEVREPSSEEDPQQHQRPIHSRVYPHQVVSPHIPQVPHQQFLPNLQLSHQQVQPQLQVQQPSWLQQHHQLPQTKWPEPLPTPQHWSTPQPHPTWQSTTPSPQPTQKSNVVWSGHHLQTPQHTMWHVQQHNVQPDSAQFVPVNQNPSPAFSVHSPPLLPLAQHQPSSQLQQASAPLHHVTAPQWPPPQMGPGVKQQWEQTVHMGDGAGPASSYKVEVINYTGQ